MAGSPHKSIMILTFFLWCSLTAGLAAQPRPAPIVIGSRVSLFSSILNEQRELLISVPDGYDGSSARYPVLYLLDGDWDFAYATGIVKHESSIGRIPESIVVGIANTDRIRDFTPVHSLIDIFGGTDSTTLATTGGAERFRLFLANEVIPYADTHYKTLPYRTLFGHSLGGVFVTYALETSPEAFGSYIDVSPAFYGGNTAVVESVTAFLRFHPDLAKILYVALGKEPLLEDVTRSLTERIKASAPSSLRWTFSRYEREDHASVPLVALYDGLRFIFKDWWLDVQDSMAVRSYQDLVIHYHHLSLEFGTNPKVPEDMANALGYRLMQTQHRIEEAIRVFRENAKSYPGSFNVYDSLGEAYAAQGNTKLAIENYEKSLKLNPKNEDGRRMLEKLRQ